MPLCCGNGETILLLSLQPSVERNELILPSFWGTKWIVYCHSLQTPVVVRRKTISIHKFLVCVPHTSVLPHWGIWHHVPVCCDLVIQRPANNYSMLENLFAPNDHSICEWACIWPHPRLRHPPKCCQWKDVGFSGTRPQSKLCPDPRECIVVKLWMCVQTKPILNFLDLRPIHWRETNLGDWDRNHPINFQLLRFCMVFCWFYGFVFQVPF